MNVISTVFTAKEAINNYHFILNIFVKIYDLDYYAAMIFEKIV